MDEAKNVNTFEDYTKKQKILPPTEMEQDIEINTNDFEFILNWEK